MLVFRGLRIVTAVKLPHFRIQSVSISSPRGGLVIPTDLLLYPSLLQKFRYMTHILCLSYSFPCFSQNLRSLSFAASTHVNIWRKVFDTFYAIFHARVATLNLSLLFFLKWGKQTENITILRIFVWVCLYVCVISTYNILGRFSWKLSRISSQLRPLKLCIFSFPIVIHNKSVDLRADEQ